MEKARKRLAVQVRKQILECTKCGLRADCRKPVPWQGPVPARYVVIGEAPGEWEDTAGEPFVGKSGQLLRKLMKDAGTYEETAFVNTVCCHPEKNRDPAIHELNACRKNLKDQLRLLSPHHLILAGRFALHLFRPDLKISKAQGRPLYLVSGTWTDEESKSPLCPIRPTHHPIHLMPIYHPAYALRNKKAQEDIAQALYRLEKVEEGWLPLDCYSCGEPVQRWDRWGLGTCEEHYENV